MQFFREVLDALESQIVVDIKDIVKCPPAPRLVCVELNPGPQPKIVTSKPSLRGQMIGSLPYKESTVRAPAQKKGKKRKNKKKHSRPNAVAVATPAGVMVKRAAEHPTTRGRSALISYLKCLTNPQIAPPIRLGWGCFRPSNISTAFYRYSGALNSNTVFSFQLNPRNFNIAGPATLDGSGFFSTAFGTSTSVSNSTQPVSAAFAAANSAGIVTSMGQWRVIAASMRAVVKYPATSTRGILFGTPIFDQCNSWASSSSANLYNFLPSVMAVSSEAGQVGIEVMIAPSDPDSFNFKTQVTATTITELACISGSAWPTGTTIDVWSIAHLEGTPEVTDFNTESNGGEANVETLSTAGVTMDQAGNAVSGLDLVKPSISVMEMADHALNNVTRSLGRSGMGLPRGKFGLPNDNQIDTVPVATSSSRNDTSFTFVTMQP